MAEKYDFKERIYKKFSLPKGAAMICANMTDLVCCANCGNPVRYGESYTSQTIHNQYGIGYCICSKCHEDEITEINKKAQKICRRGLMKND